MRVLSLVMIIFLTACQSIGVQYKPPELNQPAALLKGRSYIINSFNQSGCYSGRTHVDADQRVHAQQPIVLSVEGTTRSDEFCRASVQFVPETDQTYLVSGRFSRKLREGTFIPISDGVCSLSVMKVMPDGSEQPIPTKAVALRSTALTCIQAVER